MMKLFGLLLSGLATIIPALVAFFGRKYAVAFACIAAFVALTIALIAALKTLVTALAPYLILPPWLAYIAWFIPANFFSIFSILVSARIIRAAYDVSVEKLRLINSSS